MSARSRFGGSGSSLTVNGHLTQVDADIDERVPVYSASRTVSSTPEEHYSSHERSFLGQAMRFAYALHGAYSMATALQNNLQRLAAPEPALERARSQVIAHLEEGEYSERERKALREEIDQAFADPQVQRAVRKVEQAQQLLARAREAEAAPTVSHEGTYEDLSERARIPEALSIYDVREPAPTRSPAGRYARQALLAAREGYNALQGYLEEHPRAREALATGLNAAGTVLHAAWVASCTAQGAMAGLVAGGGVGSVPLAAVGASGGYAFALASEQAVGEALQAGSNYVASLASDLGDTPQERADLHEMTQSASTAASILLAKGKGRGALRSSLATTSSSKSRSVVVRREDFIGRSSRILPLDRPGRVMFDGVEFRGVRRLDHLSEGDLKRMAKTGAAPRDQSGYPLEIHHFNQQYHRNAGAFMVEIPETNHCISNSIQHPLGKSGGLTREQRSEWNNLRRAFHKERAKTELARRADGIE